MSGTLAHWAELERTLLSPVWGRIFPLIVERGEGAYLFDVEGRRYLDFTSGIGVTNTGHAHPRVVQAVQEQAAKLLHGQVNIARHTPLLRLAERLRDITPPGLDQFFFSNSGAEAVEASIKLARHATGRTNIIAFQGSFHGRTVGTMSLTSSKTVYRVGYQPLMAGVFFAPFPYAYRYGWDEATAVDFALKELKFILKTQTAPEETAAILVEPVLGEGGYVPAPRAFLEGLREIADHYGILLIADEVQTGFGRTGTWFAVEHSDVVPDILVMAKGIASGLPLSGIAARPELMAKWKVGTHGGTYGGNVVAAAAAIATVDVIKEEDLLANARERGAQLMEALRALQRDHPVIGDVRGVGLMVASEFTHPDGTPATEVAKATVKAAFERGLLLLTCGPWDNTIRWIPPLVVTQEQMAEALRIFSEALAVGEATAR
ncbi:MAG: aminotransferase class III-fold pyridoxal phosphate-dependent enzyme [Chloroflexi bacterium]|nr:aminotransferase class III-fold pyridoxal phosphate-dependent enzyme [Chloroflexota bacterium]